MAAETTPRGSAALPRFLSTLWNLQFYLSTPEPRSDSCSPCHLGSHSTSLSLSFPIYPVGIRHPPCLPHRAAEDHAGKICKDT